MSVVEVLKALKTNKYANMKQRSSQKNLDEKSSKIVVAEEDEQHTYIELKRSDIEMKLVRIYLTYVGHAKAKHIIKSIFYIVCSYFRICGLCFFRN